MKCPFCGKEYQLLSTLIRHAKTHRFSECPICGLEVKNIATHFANLSTKCVHHAIVGVLFSRWVASRYYSLAVEALENGYQIPKRTVRQIPRSSKVYVVYDNTMMICCERDYLLILKRNEVESLNFRTKRQLVEQLEQMGYKIYPNYANVIYRAIVDYLSSVSRKSVEKREIPARTEVIL